MAFHDGEGLVLFCASHNELLCVSQPHFKEKTMRDVVHPSTKHEQGPDGELQPPPPPRQNTQRQFRPATLGVTIIEDIFLLLGANGRNLYLSR